MGLAIIIPARNEEKTLPYLLSSIKEQSIQDIKIIVSDADSKDKTKEIAKRYGCEVIKGGNPSEGRNRGIEKAIKEGFNICMVTDADAILPSKDFIEQSLKEFKERNLDLAGTLQKPFDIKAKIDLNNTIKTCKPSKHLGYILMYSLTNFFLKLFENTKNPKMGNGIFLKTKIYEKIGGFDETIEFGEDSRYAKYILKKGYKFGILKKSKKMLTSPRRFEENGFWSMVFLYIYIDIKMLLGYKFKIGGKLRYFNKNENNQRNNKLQ